MSDLLTSPPEDGEDGSRGRAVWGLVALAIVAALIVVVMLATSGGSGGHHSGSGPTGLSQLPSEVPSSPTTAPSTTAASTAASTSASSSTAATSPVPTSTGNPCGTAKSCAVPGDAGQLVAAVNRFRTGHGRAAVTGTVTPQAQQCAVAQGDGPACAPSYAWEPVPTQDGPRAVGLVSAQWLLDPSIKSFQVGWAYANGQWECAILKLR